MKRNIFIGPFFLSLVITILFFVNDVAGQWISCFTTVILYSLALMVSAYRAGQGMPANDKENDNAR